MNYPFKHGLSVLSTDGCLFTGSRGDLFHIFIEYLYYHAACKIKRPLREQHTFKLTWTSLSANYRLQVFHYRFYSPSAASVSFIIIPRAPEAVKLTLHLPWCSCSRLGSGRSRTARLDTLAQWGYNNSAALAVGGCCGEHRSNSSHPHHHHRTHMPAHTHTYEPVHLEAEITAPPQALLHIQRLPHEGASWHIESAASWTTELFRCSTGR